MYKEQHTATIITADIFNLGNAESSATFFMEIVDEKGNTGNILEIYSLQDQEDLVELALLTLATGLKSGEIDSAESMAKFVGRKVSVTTSFFEVDGELAMMREFFPYQGTANNDNRKDEKNEFKIRRKH